MGAETIQHFHQKGNQITIEGQENSHDDSVSRLIKTWKQDTNSITNQQHSDHGYEEGQATINTIQNYHPY